MNRHYLCLVCLGTIPRNTQTAQGVVNPLTQSLDVFALIFKIFVRRWHEKAGEIPTPICINDSWRRLKSFLERKGITICETCCKSHRGLIYAYKRLLYATQHDFVTPTLQNNYMDKIIHFKRGLMSVGQSQGKTTVHKCLTVGTTLLRNFLADRRGSGLADKEEVLLQWTRVQMVLWGHGQCQTCMQEKQDFLFPVKMEEKDLEVILEGEQYALPARSFCGNCRQSYYSKSYFAKHLEWHQRALRANTVIYDRKKNKRVSWNQVKKGNQEDFYCRCIYCKKRFEDLLKGMWHAKEQCSKRITFACAICQDQFRSVLMLVKHAQLHIAMEGLSKKLKKKRIGMGAKYRRYFRNIGHFLG